MTNQLQALTSLAPALLLWYDQHARPLPWRQQATPYHIWISEVMLQQTQVATVLPYYERFLAKLPDIKALAQAEDDQLFKLWEGLGYYSRARNLKKAAMVAVEQYGGQLPTTYDQLLKLPGIGEYTAGAIASIAYGQAVPAVDGNVLRVFSRILASDHDITLGATKKYIQTMVSQALPNERAGDFNQSVMELGATICLPKAEPKCQQCPVSQLCQGYLTKNVHKYPVKSSKKPRKQHNKTVMVIICQEQVLLIQRPKKGLLAGLWGYYMLEGHLQPAEIQALLSDCQLTIQQMQYLGDAQHLFTHLQWNMQGWAIWVAEPIKWAKGQWVTADMIQQHYPLPTAIGHYTKQALTLLSAP